MQSIEHKNYIMFLDTKTDQLSHHNLKYHKLRHHKLRHNNLRHLGKEKSNNAGDSDKVD